MPKKREIWKQRTSTNVNWINAFLSASFFSTSHEAEPGARRAAWRAAPAEGRGVGGVGLLYIFVIE